MDTGNNERRAKGSIISSKSFAIITSQKRLVAKRVALKMVFPMRID